MSGAGKSTVCRAFAESGFDVIDCDLSSREVVRVGSPALLEIRSRLSEEIILPDGSLDRRKTSEMIFHDAAMRERFNKIIYPYITYNIRAKLKSSGRFAVLDAPTLFEAGLGFMCGRIVGVIADEGVCVKRIMQRDNIPEELARARLSSQHDAEFFRVNADIIIENNGAYEALQRAAADIAAKLKGTT